MVKLTQVTKEATSEKTRNRLADCFDQVIKENPGFLRILEETCINSSKKRAQEIAPHFDKMIILGIGGSSLGAKAIVQAFDCNDKVSFLENLDSYSFDIKMKKLKKLGDLTKIHWVAVSKSGSTIETLTLLQFVHEFYKKENLDLIKQTTVVTEKKSNPLYDWAQKNNVPALQIPLDVGGRFSVLSTVGLFPASFAGLEVEGLVNGAKDALKNKSTLVEFCSQIAQSFENEKWITALWIYSESLKTFGLWFQQLWAESLAKKKTIDGKVAARVSTPLTMLGSNDQHSLLQQVAEGAKDKFFIFLRSDREENSGEKLNETLFPEFKFLAQESMGKVFKAQVMGTQSALHKEGIDSLTLQLTKFDEFEMGSLFLFFEMAVAMLGKYHNIDTYNQPGVELSKKLASDQLKV
jgi:glucose-6-phosphate isomerase